MKNFIYFLLCVLYVFFIQANEVMVDPDRIQQVLPHDDGRHLLVQLRTLKEDAYEYQLALFHTDTKKIENLGLRSSSLIVATWGPGTRMITYVTNNKNNSRVISYNISTHKKQILASIPAKIISLHYSSNWKKLALVASNEIKLTPYYFEGEIRPKQSLWIVDRVKKRTTRFAEQLGSVDTPVQWFDDEKRLLVAHRPSLEYFDSWQGTISIVNEDGTFNSINDTKGLNQNPLLAPNQQQIVFSTNKADTESSRPEVFQFGRVVVYDVLKKTRLLLPETSDGSPTLLAINSRDNSILFSEAKNGSINFNTLSLESPYKERPLAADLGIRSKWSRSHKKEWLGYTDEGPTRASRICLRSLIDGVERCFALTKEPDLSFLSYETVHYPAADGKMIEAFLIRPKNFSGPLPTIVVAHGGPTYHSFHEYVGNPYSLGTPFSTASMVKKGFAVFMPNIRGSIGYGPDFRMANYGDLGGKDYDDIIAGLNYLVKQKVALPGAVGIFGWSYGGFLCEQAATQSALFKTAVCGAAISNWASHDGTSDFKAYVSGYFHQNYSQDLKGRQLMLERSPALNLKNTSTSLLLLHGTHDSAVNFGQALEIFWALKKKNAKVKLAAFPNEGHVFSKPSSLNGATTLVSDWFVEHLMAKVARNQKLHRVSLHQFRLDMAP